ncbi:hypothetical protein OU997_07940 [Pseudomonas sp. SL4(2022)]|uniref:hypothetical protein n=1 Tax=Pseudomonas sp. SL4(2022) TaxID=2994661 RepID=UPI00226F4FCF|nr:hypothetical protein [Pseudomonas sp. SL4(2022)]WAC46079.1 hypothetical protein OU997_07940 [Pseudomonas sp. SL4(2022)]
MKSSTGLRGRFSEQYVDLLQRFGEEAAAVRHEMFFLAAGRSPLMARLRACAALLRDVWLLLFHTGPEPRGSATHQAVMLTTLAGVSGWGTLSRSLPDIAATGYQPLVLAHPRLRPALFAAGLPVMRPARIGWRSWMSALRTFMGSLKQYPLTLACCLTRRRLWVASLQKTLAECRGVLLLHNDFDLMSRAAIGLGLPAICLQHGIPTDEFFPTHADWYVVWGSSSRRAFTAQTAAGTRLIEDALGRGEMVMTSTHSAPTAVALLSQTHAQVLGDGIHGMLSTFAADLLDVMPQARILLHPQEGQPYIGAVATATRQPPHAELKPAATACCLVAGYCSTAMLDAALAGHWVVTLRLPLAGNTVARDVVAAPLQVETADQLSALYRRLQEDHAFRLACAEAQNTWLAACFSRPSGSFADLLQRLKREQPLERDL